MRAYLFFLYLFLFSAFSFSQNNIGFETGTTAGWVCKYGYYGAGSCPSGTCPRFSSAYPNFGQLNPGGINAPLLTGGNRHTITTGTGTDPNSVAPNLIPVVAPGGVYSFRLGDGNTGVVNNNYAQAEAIRLTFPVTNQNASFTYRYALFVQYPGHTFDGQPAFEAVVLNKNDSIIPCGRYFVVAGNYPSCVNVAGFINGNSGYVFKNWTDVGLDLRTYIGQNISIEFRTTDCMVTNGCGGMPSCAGNICTICCNTCCCTYMWGFPVCAIPAPNNVCDGAYPGTHSSYAYLDAYSGPMEINVPAFCTGTSSIQICAPAGYKSYTWPAGQPGISGTPSTQCITLNNPVGGTTYTVNMVSATGCASTATVTLQEAALRVNSETICAGDSTILTASGAGNYTWSTGETTTSIWVKPSATASYTVTSPMGTCTASAVSVVTVGNTIFPFIYGPSSVCSGSAATLSAFGGNTYSWNTGATTSSIIVAPSTTSTYSVTVSKGSCSGATSYILNAMPLPPVPTITANTNTLVSSSSAGNQWYLNGNPISCTGWEQSYVVTQNGVYTVCVTDAKGCSSCSAPYNYTAIGISELSNEMNVWVFPNPANSAININVEGQENQEYIVRVYNSVGAKVAEQKFSKQTKISTAGFSKGIYQVQVCLPAGEAGNKDGMVCHTEKVLIG